MIVLFPFIFWDDFMYQSFIDSVFRQTLSNACTKTTKSSFSRVLNEYTVLCAWLNAIIFVELEDRNELAI